MLLALHDAGSMARGPARRSTGDVVKSIVCE